MNLRRRTMLIIGLALTALSVANVIFASRSILDRFSRIEDAGIRLNVSRALEALDDSLSALRGTAGDWANWDDMYQAIKTRDMEFLKSNIRNKAFRELNLDLMVLADASGATVFARRLNPDKNLEIPLPLEFQEHIGAPDRPLLNHRDESSVVQGILMLGDTPMAVVSRPVLTGDGQGPAVGTLIMGRMLDGREVGRLAERTRLDVSLLRANAPEVLPILMELEGLEANGTCARPIHRWNRQGDEISGAALLHDLYGKPALVVSVNLPAELIAETNRAMRDLGISALAINLAFGLVLLLVMGRWVVRPLMLLDASVTRIARSGNVSERLDMKGNDEVASLATSINGMLGALEHSQEELKTARDELESRVRERAADLVRANEAYRKSEQWLEAIFESVQAGIVIVDAETREVVHANAAATDSIGIRLEELQGTSACAHICPQQGGRCRVLDQGERVGNLECAVTRKDGATIHILKTVVPAEIEGRSYLLESFIDMTETRKARDEKHQLELQLRQAQKMEALGTLAGGIAHDFNNILSVIFGCAEMSLLVAPPKGMLRSKLTQLLQAAHRARELVRQILTFSRRDPVGKGPVSLRPIIEETLGFLRASFPPDIEIRQSLETNGTVVVDPTQIRQVIMNLCTNACLSMKESGGVLDLRLRSRLLPPDEAAAHPGVRPGMVLELTVRDTGCGMDEATLERIFEPYYTTRTPGEGTGLGLAIVHGIVREIGGAIRVESEPGNGSTFSVLLPESSTARETEPGQAPLPLARRGERVLVVDDEEGIASSCRDMLVFLGYDVSIEISAVAALYRFWNEPEAFDLVLTDELMPVMSGLDMAEKLLRIRPGVPVILCTGAVELAEGELPQGIRKVLVKPFGIHELSAAVHDILGKGGVTLESELVATVR